MSLSHGLRKQSNFIFNEIVELVRCEEALGTWKSWDFGFGFALDISVNWAFDHVTIPEAQFSLGC